MTMKTIEGYIKESYTTDNSTIMEFRASRSNNSHRLYLDSCKTVSELRKVLSIETNFIERPKYIRPGKSYGSDDDFIKYIHDHCNGEISSMILEYDDQMRRDFQYYDIFIVNPNENKAYLIRLNEIGDDGKIHWKTRYGWSIESMVLEPFRIVRVEDSLSKLSEKEEILSEI